ncbi:MAG TPA: hypothetical protein VFU22_12590 [Roseiflexaceae bacterium]|nr:hypothetical protein [Roseiflexaceae bacterium]
MNHIRRAIVGGLTQARRAWLILPLYLVGLALGLLQAWPLLVAGGNALHNPFLDQLVSGGSDALLDLFIGSPAAAPQALAWAGSSLLLAQLFGLAYTLFSGGMLSVAAGKNSFWSGCRRFFWSFLGLGAVLVLLAALLLVFAGLGGTTLGRANTGLLIGLLLLQLLNVVGEFARAIGVARDRRNPFVLFGAALAFCLRHPGGVLALGLLGALLHIAVIVLYLGLAQLPLGVGALLAQQLIVLLWLWIKLLRLTWALSYVSSLDADATHTPMPDGVSPSGIVSPL